MADPAVPVPPAIDWPARLLALLLALLGIGAVGFVLWALVFKSNGDEVGLVGALAPGLLFAGVCGRLAILGRIGPMITMDLGQASPRTPLGVRAWAGLVAVLWPFSVRESFRGHAFPAEGWYGWFDLLASALLGIYVFALMVRLCLGAFWPGAILRFARRANLTARAQLAETRREHEHRHRF